MRLNGRKYQTECLTRKKMGVPTTTSHNACVVRPSIGNPSTAWARKSTAASDPRVGVTFGHQSQERLTHLTTCGDRETCEAQLALQFFQLLAPAASNTSGPGVIWDGNSSGDVFGDLYISADPSRMLGERAGEGMP